MCDSPRFTEIPATLNETVVIEAGSKASGYIQDTLRQSLASFQLQDIPIFPVGV